MSAEDLEHVERLLINGLASWAVASVAGGAVTVLSGRRTHRAELVSFGRQTAAWGAVDGAIAGVGALARHRRGPLAGKQADAKVRSLRRALVINAAADVAYVAVGVLVVIRGRQARPALRMGTGDGIAIIIQGAFLFVLDVSQARRLVGFSRLARLQAGGQVSAADQGECGVGMSMANTTTLSR